MAKIGRNSPCPCGSGKKYKHCCLKSENPEQEITMRLKGKYELSNMNERMRKGYELLRKGDEIGAYNEWFLFWEELQGFHISKMKTITDAEKIFPFDQFLAEWSGDMLKLLENLCQKEVGYREKHKQFAQDFCRLFPETEGNLMKKMKAAADEE